MVKLEYVHHREERHVKIRVELGPKEAAAGQCVVAKCKKPGAVAAKTTVRVRPAAAAFVADRPHIGSPLRTDPAELELQHSSKAVLDAMVLKDVSMGPGENMCMR